jgi:flagellar biosynthesis chaperone FliJ
MSTYELEKLLEMWQGEKLTPEQAIGHIMQHLLALRAQLYEAEERLRKLERGEEGNASWDAEKSP